MKLKQTAKFSKPLGLLLLLVSTQLGISSRNVSAQIAPPATKQEVPTKKVCPAQLTGLIDAIANRPQFSRVRWGILVQTLSPSQTLYSQDAEKFFIPASNVKLLTTAAALHKLGANHRIRTSVYGNSEGALLVVGRGDPSLTDAQLRELAKQLRASGVSQASQLIADDSYFPGDIVNPEWEWGDLDEYYAAPINSLILNQNTVLMTLLPQAVGKPLRIIWANPTEITRWRIVNQTLTAQAKQPAFFNVSRDLNGAVLRIQGQLAADSQPQPLAVAVIDPVEHFLRHFRQALAIEGIKTADIGRYTQISNPGSELAAIESPPLSELLMETNQNSNNLYAEALLRALGVSKDNKQNAAATGLEVLQATLTELGVDPASYVVTDGSGLSRHNLVTPKALVQTLQGMTKSPQASVFRASLPVAGVSGSLKNRFVGTPAVGIVQAKTGSMSGVVSLSGYVNAPNYQPVVFSIIVNQSDQRVSVLRQAIDEMVVVLSQLHRC